MTLDQTIDRGDTIRSVVTAYFRGDVDRHTAIQKLKNVKPVPISEDGARDILVTLDKLKEKP